MAPPEVPSAGRKQASLAVRAGQQRSSEGEQSEPIFLTSSFRFTSAAQAAARFAGDEDGNIYSRFTNPTVRVFERRLAALEGAEDCFATATGMGALLTAMLGLCQAGSKIVAAHQLFGATINLLRNIIAKFDVQVELVSGPEPKLWQQAAGGKATLLLVESPSNPQLAIYDIAALADIARAAGATLLVDNCMCTPILQRPLEFGADLVMHSATKYIDGHGRAMGGALCGSTELIRERLYPVLRSGGATLSPFNAWVLAKGLETLPLRMPAVSATAAGLAAWLIQQPAVADVFYPFASDHPDAALARRQQSAGGGIVSFTLAGGQQSAWRVLDALRMISITANFGDTKSTATHPASTTHARLSADERTAVGIGEGLIRLSAGLEDPEDIRADLNHALKAV